MFRVQICRIYPPSIIKCLFCKYYPQKITGIKIRPEFTFLDKNLKFPDIPSNHQILLTAILT